MNSNHGASGASDHTISKSVIEIGFLFFKYENLKNGVICRLKSTVLKMLIFFDFTDKTVI